jgi:PAS domain S-box-containing protein
MTGRFNLENESSVFRAVAHRAASRVVRVRLLVAVPAVIVLLLGLMAALFYWMTDAYLSPALQQQAGALQDFSRDWLFLLAVFVISGALIGYILAWSLTRPIQQIIRLSERVASGDLKLQVEVTRQDEMGQLGSSFNYMVSSLSDYMETRNKFIVESFSGGLIVTDLNGTITAVNSAAEKMLGLNSNEVSGKSVREVFATPELADLLKLHERVIWKQETIVDKRLELSCDGTTRRVVVGFTPMRDSSETIFGVIINIRDSAELEKFYQHMRNTDRLATMGTFATGLAHEIRNPLGAIKGTAQLLTEDLGPNHRASEYLHIITKEVNRLDTLISEVQSYSQPAADKVPADINRLVDEIVDLAKADPRHREKPFHLEVDNQPIPRVTASRNQMRQALLNILLNAFYAVHEDGIVRVSVAHDPDNALPVKISIANQGPPIPADIQARIFEPFYTTKASGTGLGLSIAYQVAVNHSGRLFVDSSDGWVTFTMRLPDTSTPFPLDSQIPV